MSTRLYLNSEVNDEIDRAHLDAMARCGYRISKADFIATVFRLGLSDEDGLLKAYPKTGGKAVDKVA